MLSFRNIFQNVINIKQTNKLIFNLFLMIRIQIKIIKHIRITKLNLIFDQIVVQQKVMNRVSWRVVQ